MNKHVVLVEAIFDERSWGCLKLMRQLYCSTVIGQAQRFWARLDTIWHALMLHLLILFSSNSPSLALLLAPPNIFRRDPKGGLAKGGSSNLCAFLVQSPSVRLHFRPHMHHLTFVECLIGNSSLCQTPLWVLPNVSQSPLYQTPLRPNVFGARSLGSAHEPFTNKQPKRYTHALPFTNKRSQTRRLSF